MPSSNKASLHALSSLRLMTSPQQNTQVVAVAQTFKKDFFVVSEIFRYIFLSRSQKVLNIDILCYLCVCLFSSYT